MTAPPSSTPRTRRGLRLLALLVLTVAAAAGGAAVVVRAAIEPAPRIVPYDPLPRW